MVVGIVKNAGMTSEPVAPMSQIKVVPYREKGDWELVPKYNIGNKKN